MRGARRLSLLLAGLLFAGLAAAQDRLSALAGDGSVMLVSPDGEALVSVNPERALVPASLLKIPLAHVALTTLGEDFRFETHFYTNREGDLLLRGLGDPFLVSEEIARIAETLVGLGLSDIRRLVVDDSAFEPDPDLPLEPNTDQPYGARTGALAVNFNTVNLAWATDGRLISGEPQTPLTPLARELGRRLSPGAPQRINLGDNPEAGLRQAQQLFAHFLTGSGITISDNQFYRAPLDPSWTLLYRHANSRSLPEILAGLLRYSNNFIANQLFLTLGAHSEGYPATVEAARAVLQRRLAELYDDGFGIDPQSLLMVEGSGLSRAQRSTGAAMIQILEAFEPYADLMPQFDGVLRKSGTLTGVYNYAGYLRGTDGLYPFVILTNQPANQRDAILRLLRQRL